MTTFIASCHQGRAIIFRSPLTGETASTISLRSFSRFISQISSHTYVTGGSRGSLFVISHSQNDPAPPALLSRITGGHTGKVYSSHFDRSSRLLFTAGADGKIGMWDSRLILQDEETSHEDSASEIVGLREHLSGHVGPVWDLLIPEPDQNPHRLLSSSFDSNLRLWDLNVGSLSSSPIRSPPPHEKFFGMAYDPQHQLVFVSSAAAVYGFDLRSHTFPYEISNPEIGIIRSCAYRPQKSQLVVPAGRGLVMIYDCRSLGDGSASPQSLNRFYAASLGGEQFRDSYSCCDVPDLDYFVVSRLSGSVTAWKDSGDMVWRSFGNDAVGVTPILKLFDDGTEESEEANEVEGLDSRVAVILDSGCCDATVLVDSEGEERKCSRPLLCCSSRLALYDEGGKVKSVTLEKSYPLIDTENLLRRFLGSPVPDQQSEELFDYYCLFSELNCDEMAHAICCEVESISDINTLQQLVNRCEFNHVESVNEPIYSELTPFEESLARNLFNRKSEIPEPILISITRKVPFLSLDSSHPFWDRTLKDTLNFADLEFSALTLRSAFKRTIRKLHLTRSHTNVVLTTVDGGEERAHIEILIARSNLFLGLMRFQGKEYHSFQESKVIQMEGLSHASLQAMLCLIYGVEFSECDQFAISDLFDLVTKAHMHRERWFGGARSLLLSTLKKRIAEESTHLLLLEIGWMIEKLPVSMQRLLMGVFVRKLSEDDEMITTLMTMASRIHSMAQKASQVETEDVDAEQYH